MSNVERSFRIIQPEPEETAEVESKDEAKEPLAEGGVNNPFLVKQEEVDILPFNQYRLGNLVNSAHQWDHAKKKALEWKPELAYIDNIEDGNGNNGIFYLTAFGPQHNNKRHAVDVDKVRPVILKEEHLIALFNFRETKAATSSCLWVDVSQRFILTLHKYESMNPPEYYLCDLKGSLLPGANCRIKYVHQLQNLFLAITNEEAFITHVIK